MRRNRILATLCLALATTAVSARLQAASVTVNTENDTTAADTECSLREAIQSVNNNSVNGGCIASDAGTIDTVILPAGTYVLSLTGINDDNDTGDLDVLANLTLNGEGSATTTISAQGLEDNAGPERVLHIDPLNENLNVAINGVTIRDGLDASEGGGILIQSGLTTVSVLKLGVFDGTFTLATLNDVNVVENETDDDGGGIAIEGATVVINGGTISGNVSPEEGGGVFNLGGELEIGNAVIDSNSAVFGGGVSSTGLATIDSSTISNNHDACIGGGLAVEGEATVTNSTLSGNRADGSCPAPAGIVPENLGGGAAVSSEDSLILVDSTVSGNFASNGGGGIVLGLIPAAPAPVPATIKLGIVSFPGLHLYNATIAGNDTDGSGGGVLVLTIFATGLENLLTAANTIIANNTAASNPDCLADFISQGYNLVEDVTGCNGFTAAGDQTGVDPNLGPLQDNGGPTFTQALLVGSPAIDTANPTGCLDNNDVVLSRDQRGSTRPVNATGLATAVCDIGAFEFQVLPTPSPTPTPTAAPFLLNGTGCALGSQGSSRAPASAALVFLVGLAALAYRRRQSH